MFRVLFVLVLLPAVALAQADTVDSPVSPWSGSSGELGFAAAHGNSSSESFNACAFSMTAAAGFTAWICSACVPVRAMPVRAKTV